MNNGKQFVIKFQGDTDVDLQPKFGECFDDFNTPGVKMNQFYYAIALSEKGKNRIGTQKVY